MRMAPQPHSAPRPRRTPAHAPASARVQQGGGTRSEPPVATRACRACMQAASEEEEEEEDAERARRSGILLELASAAPETLEATIARHRASIDEALLEMLFSRIQVAQRFDEVRRACMWLQGAPRLDEARRQGLRALRAATLHAPHAQRCEAHRARHSACAACTAFPASAYAPAPSARPLHACMRSVARGAPSGARCGLQRGGVPCECVRSVATGAACMQGAEVVEGLLLLFQRLRNEAERASVRRGHLRDHACCPPLVQLFPAARLTMLSTCCAAVSGCLPDDAVHLLSGRLRDHSAELLSSCCLPAVYLLPPCR